MDAEIKAAITGGKKISPENSNLQSGLGKTTSVASFKAYASKAF
jgi:hypothetical protein